MKIQIIIFSFNRAMQLDALLSSISKYIDKDLCERVSVIYNTSSSEYEEGYQLLKARYDCIFLKEKQLIHKSYPFDCYMSLFNWKKLVRNPKARQQHTNFRELTLQCLSETDAADLTMFLTDDSIFIQHVKLKDEWLRRVCDNPSKIQLSLRLGKQFDVQPLQGKEQDGLMSWKYSDNPQNTNWGYRFSVDAHLYQTQDLKRVLSKCIFTNPSFLEGFVQDYARCQDLWNQGYSLTDPCILSYPLNMVQDVANNESQNVSPQLMNSLFLKGYQIVYPMPKRITAFQQYPAYIEFLNSETNQKEQIRLSNPTYQFKL